MAYPDKINALVDVSADETLAAGGHAARHNDVNDALDELEAVFTAPATDELALRPDGSTEAVRIESSGRVVLSDSLLSSGQLIRSGDDSITNQASLLFYRSGAGSTTGTRASLVTRGDASGNVDRLSVEIGGSRRVGFLDNGAVLIGTETPGSAGAGDLVVDGGVFLGGSAAANELDDYEEGTFTLSTLTVQSGPTPGAGASYSGTYTKIGNVVTCFVNIQFDDSGTSVAVDDRFYFSSGLPFAEANTEFPSVGTFLIRAALSSGVAALGQVIVGNSNLWFYVTHVDGSPDYGDEFNGQFTYITNS